MTHINRSRVALLTNRVLLAATVGVVVVLVGWIGVSVVSAEVLYTGYQLDRLILIALGLVLVLRGLHEVYFRNELAQLSRTLPESRRRLMFVFTLKEGDADGFRTSGLIDLLLGLLVILSQVLLLT